MSMENELGGLLRNKANDVPHHSEAPRSLTRRVRRRMAFNAAIVGTALVVIAGGAFVGVRMLNGPKPIAPAGSVPTTSVAPTPLGSQVTSSAPPVFGHGPARSCTAGQLRAVGSLQGAAGSREGEIDLTNFSDTVCTLQGSPTLTLLDQNLKPITSGVTFSSSP
ncbi:MAG: hypothetical protein QOC87_1564, partial [Actinomycetota bacterium]|nr:hypothetical protein [Actinomycetota bacterium]